MYKNLLLITTLISVCIFQSLKCQDITNNYDSWTTIDKHNLLFEGSWDLYTYKFDGDTTINENNYLIVKKVEDIEERIICFLRDLGNSKYNLRDIHENEGLIYDFNVCIDDTFEICNPLFDPDNNIKVYVSDSTSVNFAGEVRTKYTITSKDLQISEVWISGIGSLSGIIRSGIAVSGITGTNPELLCLHQSNNNIYLNPGYTNCDGSTGLNYIASYFDLQVFPNPFPDKISIKSARPFIQLKVYSIIGKEVYSEKALYNKDRTVVLSNLSNGLYILQVQLSDHSIHSFKILKTNQ
jgi:hypothetical protein